MLSIYTTEIDFFFVFTDLYLDKDAFKTVINHIRNVP